MHIPVAIARIKKQFEHAHLYHIKGIRPRPVLCNKRSKHFRTSRIENPAFLSAQPYGQSHKAVYYGAKYEASRFHMLDASHKKADQLHKAF
jgi:hypothetical protein